jgi:acetylornithine/N-succinyldiaminopimelate aminotransferase
MNSNEIKDIYKDNVMQTYARFDVAIDRGEGAKVYSPEGKEYIDFTSGIGVNSLGYGNVKWAEAIYKQALKLQHMSNLFYTEPGAALAKKLTGSAGMSAVFYSNSGAEANEGAIKIARKYSFDKYGQGRSKIITLVQSFHGRTITTLAATGQDSFHQFFFPFTEGFVHAKANDLGSLKAAVDKETCAVMIELIQGEGGVLPLQND